MSVMKYYLFFFCFLLLNVNVSAQKETTKWYFGNNAALDFLSGAPVAIAGSNMTALEGVSSIADSNGTTLFYTNGVSVWNVLNQTMPNGFGLFGDDNSAQSALIIQDPGNSGLYYIFTTPTNANNGMHYSIVDMSLQGGLGDVLIKNVFMFANATEKVSAVRHANGTDIWVIGHEWNTNNFYVFLLTQSGLVPIPSVSSVGSIHNGVLGFAGYMKASHQGHKIAYAITISLNIVELFDFDNSTGIVSNPVLMNNIQEAYGIEFSPDDSKLYATSENPGELFQWDVNAGSSAAIIASQMIVGNDVGGQAFASLQLAYDGKIYLANRFSNFLGVINNPNAAGLACNFVDNAITLTQGSSQYGLPNYFQSYFDTTAVSTVIPVVSFQSSDTSFCGKTCLDFFDFSTNNPTSWQWLFPGADSIASNVQNPTSICYNSYGSFDVTLIACNAAGCDTLTIPGFINEYQPPAVPTVTGSNDTLFSSLAYSYQWYGSSGIITGATNQFYVYPQPGSYYVIITDSNGCATSSIVINTGVNEIINDITYFDVFPNPTTGNITISFHRNINEQMEIKVIDITGRMLLQSKVNSKNKVLNLQPFADGIYMLCITNGTTIWNKKLILNKNIK